MSMLVAHTVHDNTFYFETCGATMLLKHVLKFLARVWSVLTIV